MGDEPQGASAGEMMVFGLIEQADRVQKAALATQAALTRQVEQLDQIQRSAEATIQRLRAETGRLETTQAGIAGSAAYAIQAAVKQQAGEIERQISQALAAPLLDIRQAAAQVRQNVRDSSWMFVMGVFIAGMMLGMFAGYYFVIRTQNNIENRLDRIEQIIAPPTHTATAHHTPHTRR